jgi:hypothetical protein
MSHDSLGSRLFTLRHWSFSAMLFVWFGVLTVGVAGVFIYLHLNDPNDAPPLPPLLLIAAAGMALILAGWALRPAFSGYENGVWNHGPLGQKALRFDQIESMLWEVTNLYTSGVIYSGTNFHVCFAPARETGLSPVHYYRPALFGGHRHISIATGKYWLRTSLGVR